MPVMPGCIDPGTTPQTPGISAGSSRDRHDAGGGAHHVDHVAHAARRRRSRPSARRTRPPGIGMPARRPSFPAHSGGKPARRSRSLVAYAARQFRRARPPAAGPPPSGTPPAAGRPARVPHPLVAHGADAARHAGRVGDAAQRGRHHVAMLQRGGQCGRASRDCAAASAAAWRSPTRRSRRRRTTRSLRARDARAVAVISRRLLPGAVVAPEVVVVERLEVRVHRDHARPGGVEGERLDGAACHAGRRPAPCAWPRPAPACGRRGSAWRGPDRLSAGAADTPPMPEPSRPRSLSTIETRTLSVPKSTPATIAIEVSVPTRIEHGSGGLHYCCCVVHLPAEIPRRGLVHRRAGLAQVGRHVVLEAVLADVAQQLLQLRNLAPRPRRRRSPADRR